MSLVPVGGGAPRTIFTTGATLFGVEWYPSGNALLLLINQNRQTNMFRLDLAGGEPRQITHFTRGNIGNPTFSPDGRRLAYYRGTSEIEHRAAQAEGGVSCGLPARTEDSQLP